MIFKYSLDKGAYKPTKAHDTDAGFDLYLPDTYDKIKLYEFDSFTINTGVHIFIPKGYVGYIMSKSGLNVKDGITCEGVIDATYTGPITIKLYSNRLGDKFVKFFNPGDKIGQIIFSPIPDVTLEEIDNIDILLSENDRGNNGFGSSGSNYNEKR